MVDEVWNTDAYNGIPFGSVVIRAVTGRIKQDLDFCL